MNTSATIHTMFRRPAPWLVGLTVAGSMCFGGVMSQSAHAQDALGSGNVLDANPGRGSGGRNVPAQVPDYRARNLLITGDVAGGRGFRGTVGYRAEADFRGDMATDDLFQFRADTAFSSPAALTTFNQQLRFGQHLGTFEYRRGGPDAPRIGPPRDARLPEWDRRDVAIDERLQLDQAVQAATLGQRTRFEGDMRTVGMTYNEEGQPFMIDASSLRGLSYTSAMERYHTQGLSALDRIRLREDMASGRVTTFGAPAEWYFQQLEERDRIAQHRRPDMDPRDAESMWVDPTDPSQRAERREGRVDPWQPAADPREQRDRLAVADRPSRSPMQQQQHREIVERIARRYANLEDVEFHMDSRIMHELDEEFGRLRDRLSRRDVQLPDDPDAPTATEDDEREQPDRPREVLPGEERYDPTRAVPLLRHGQRVEELTGEERTRFNELMAMAEESLRQGEYFRAEQQFIRALRFHPGEPLATAGMAHAQLGAGLHIAASLTLQRLFVTNPEMIDVEYDESLLPSRVRLLQAVDELSERMEERRDRDSIAFLLAYIGKHLNDRDLVEQGMSVLREIRHDDPLVQLLDGVWLGDESGK